MRWYLVKMVSAVSVWEQVNTYSSLCQWEEIQGTESRHISRNHTALWIFILTLVGGNGECGACRAARERSF